MSQARNSNGWPTDPVSTFWSKLNKLHETDRLSRTIPRLGSFFQSKLGQLASHWNSSLQSRRIPRDSFRKWTKITHWGSGEHFLTTPGQKVCQYNSQQCYNPVSFSHHIIVGLIVFTGWQEFIDMRACQISGSYLEKMTWALDALKTLGDIM